MIKGIKEITPLIDEGLKFNKIRIAMNENESDYESNRISEEKYKANKSANRLKFYLTAAPMAATMAFVCYVGMDQVYQGFQAGLPFQEVFEALNPSKTLPEGNMNLLKELALDPVVRGAYIDYVKEGVTSQFDNIKDALNPAALFVAYSSIKAFTGKYIDKRIDQHNKLNSSRTLAFEEAKLNMLKEYIEEDDIKAINAHDSYRFAASFNDTLYNYKNKNRETIRMKVFDFFNKFTKGVFWAKNKITSQNNEEGVIADLIEEYNDPERVKMRFKRLGIGLDAQSYLLNQDTQTVADSLYKINSEAILNAYNQSVLDQNILAFSVFANDFNNRLSKDEELLPSERRKFNEKIDYFEKFIENKEDSSGVRQYQDSKLSPQMQHFKKTLQSMAKFDLDGDYDVSNFLNKTAPHLLLTDESDYIKVAELPFSYYFQKEVDKVLIGKLKTGLTNEIDALKENRDFVKSYDEKLSKLESQNEVLTDLKKTLTQEDVKDHYEIDTARRVEGESLFELRKPKNNESLSVELSGIDAFAQEMKQRQKIKKLLIEESDDQKDLNKRLREMAKNSLK
jgi:hypothetical protein